MGQSFPNSSVGCAPCSRPAQIIVEACGSGGAASSSSRLDSGVGAAALCQNIVEEKPPPFRVPSGIDVFEKDSDRSLIAVQTFMDVLVAGVGLRLFVEGCGDLEVKAMLDREGSVLQLAFNSVRKTVPLRLVRSVSLEEEKATEGCRVVLELDGDLFCTFVFAPGDVGANEASFFGGCIQMLVEAARFQAVKTELAGLGAVAEQHPLGPGQDLEGFTLPTTRSQCSLPDDTGGSCKQGRAKAGVLEGDGAAAVLRALTVLEEDGGQMQAQRWAASELTE